MSETFTLAMPSKGAIYKPTLDFLRDCGLAVHKPNERQYIGTMPTIPNLGVLFQRVTDVVYKVADGTAQLGITGFDVLHEHPHPDLIVIYDKLGYGWCKLVVAVPQSWVDVLTMVDLADVALDFRERKGRNIRIATKYDYATRQFLHRHGIHHFTLVKADGAIEAAPTLGYADFIVDLTQTGTTLRENHLKELHDGTIVEAEACLIANRQALLRHSSLRDVVRIMTEYIDASLQGRSFFQVTADMQSDSSDALGQAILRHSLTQGLLGPTIAPIRTVNEDGSWFTVTLTIARKQLLRSVDALREMGAKHVMASPVRYLFHEQAPTYAMLIKALSEVDDVS